jgi:hypothetical protein
MGILHYRTLPCNFYQNYFFSPNVKISITICNGEVKSSLFFFQVCDVAEVVNIHKPIDLAK